MPNETLRTPPAGHIERWDLPPEPIPSWLDPDAEVREEHGPRPAPRGPFVVTCMEACLTLGCDVVQAAGVTANAIVETGWGSAYRGCNLSGVKIREDDVEAYKTRHGAASPPWSRAPGNQSSGDPPWCYYRAYPSLQAFFEEWLATFVPREGEGSRYQRTGARFWSGRPWFPELVEAGYRGERARQGPGRSLREHEALVVTALRMWAQSRIGARVDGVWAAASTEALQRWQRAHGLPDRGTLDEATLRALTHTTPESLETAPASSDEPLDAAWPAWALSRLPDEANTTSVEGFMVLEPEGPVAREAWMDGQGRERFTSAWPPSRGPAGSSAPTPEGLAAPSALESAPQPEDASPRALDDRLSAAEFSDFLQADASRANDLLTRMFPREDPAELRRRIAETRDAAKSEAAALEGVLDPFRRIQVDAAELAAFCAEHAVALPAPLAPDLVRDTSFETAKDWHGYVRLGAIQYHLGESVAPPMKPRGALLADEATFSLDHDPAAAPVTVDLFADFGNGLYAAQGIARQIAAAGHPYAFHLGDVYYAGTEAEFARYVRPALEPMLARTELFMLPGNHEMYSRGVPFQNYLRDKAARHPRVQRQNAECFRLRGHGVQIIGLDTMWCDWQGKGIRRDSHLDPATLALLERWTRHDPEDLTILLTADHPWTLGDRSFTRLHADLLPFLRRGAFDLWFWGNEHYATLFEAWRPQDGVEGAVIGSCIGHGGYPYLRQKSEPLPRGVRARWIETRHRFWPYAKVRPDTGMNGFCELTVDRTQGRWDVTLRYRDWVGRTSAMAWIRKERGTGARIIRAAENSAPMRDDHRWDELKG